MSVAGPLSPQSVMSSGPSALNAVPCSPTCASTTRPISALSPLSGTLNVNSDGTGSTISSPSPSRNGNRCAPPVVTTTASNGSPFTR